MVPTCRDEVFQLIHVTFVELDVEGCMKGYIFTGYCLFVLWFVLHYAPEALAHEEEL